MRASPWSSKREELGALGRLLRALDGARREPRRVRAPRRASARLARLVPEDPDQPRQQAPSLVEALGLLDRRQEGRLQDVLGLGRVAREAQREPE
jgi:hypothetical protein